MRILRSVSLLALASCALSAHANLIVNGSFENPALGPDQFIQVGSIQGWTATPPTLIEVGRSNLYGITGASGLNVVELDSNGNSIVSQTFSSNSASLILTFDYARRDGTAASTNMLSVFLNGNLVDSITPESTAMTSATYRLTGLVGSNVLTFTATGQSDSLGGIIDNVAVSTPGPAAAVPFALMALKRRKRA